MTELNKKAPLDDELLDLVMGGVSLYEGASGMDRDSWFVRLVRRRMPNGGRGVTPPPGTADQRENTAPFTTLFVGEYSGLN